MKEHLKLKVVASGNSESGLQGGTAPGPAVCVINLPKNIGPCIILIKIKFKKKATKCKEEEDRGDGSI